MSLQETGAASAQKPSLAAMVSEHWTAVYRMLFSVTGNSHDTEDLTQETFLKAMDGLPSFAPGTNLRAWLLRIASNAFLDVCRKKKRLRIKPLSGEVAAPQEPPGHAIEIAEQSTLLKAALQDLSETARLVFHLRAAEDLPFRAIGDMLGLSEEAARWHMHQARKQLLERFGKG